MKINFLSLAYGCRNDVTVLNRFDATIIFILSFKKQTFADRLFTFVIFLSLLYRKQSMNMQELFELMQYLLATNSIDVIAGDFN